MKTKPKTYKNYIKKESKVSSRLNNMKGQKTSATIRPAWYQHPCGGNREETESDETESENLKTVNRWSILDQPSG